VHRRRAPARRLAAPALLRSTTELELAIAQAIKGEHLVRYTEEDVLPRLRRAIEEVRAEAVAAQAQ